MIAANSSLFSGPNWPKTLLEARGFDPKSGARSGGIVDPKQVHIPSGTVLLRTYQDPAKAEGPWWFTPREMIQVIDYFARDGMAFAEGRQIGKGILQATMAVRHEWGKSSPSHLGMVIAVRLKRPLMALFGIGDVAPDATQTGNLKPILIMGANNEQRGVGQVFLPQAWAYKSEFTVLEREKSTDKYLIRMAKQYAQPRWAFELA